MNYAAMATHALKKNYPEFWCELHADPPGAQAMLVGYWHLFLRQAQKKKLRPGRAASDFVASARPRRTLYSACP